jgi:pyroglutamyl-peptidase
MLRRRRKSPKPDKHAPQAAPRSRRRARPDTPVPVELMLPDGSLAPPPDAPAGKPGRTRERPPRPQPVPPPPSPQAQEGATALAQEAVQEPLPGAQDSDSRPQPATAQEAEARPQPAAAQETHGRPQPAAGQETHGRPQEAASAQAEERPRQPATPPRRARQPEREPRPPRDRDAPRDRPPQRDREPPRDRMPREREPQRPMVHEPEEPPVRAPRPRGREPSLLVTGFECFGGEPINPSWEICNRLPRTLAGYRVETVRVPCEFRRAIEVVAEAIERYQPVLVLCLGQAGGRTHVSVERVAINVDDASIEDNGGWQPIDEPIAMNAPAAYFSTLPVKAMAAAMREARVPAEVSNTAGTYVCNHLMYGVLHYLAGTGNPARAGFVHVPYAEEQVLDKPGKPSLAIATMARGVEAAVAAALAQEQDITIAAGKLD